MKVEKEDRFPQARLAIYRALIRAVDRCTDLLLEKAKENVPEFEGGLKRSGKVHPAEYDSSTDQVHGSVSFDGGHALYVEMGFQGHFVPFHIAPSLYRQALVQWGYRVPTPAQLKKAKPGRLYLIPRGRNSSPVWGVFVKGDAKPFLRPAAREIEESGVLRVFAAEEIRRELREAMFEQRN